MKGFDTLKVKSAVKSHSRMDLSFNHLTTMNFGEIVPLLVEETVPGDKFNINAEYFSRMAPLVKPTYGKFAFKTIAGFVPYHQLAFDADAWIAGKSVFEGQTPHQRWFDIGDLVSFVINYCVDTSDTGATADNCDFAYKGGNPVVNKYVRFTTKGKLFVKILNALGYALPEGVSYASADYWNTTLRNTKLSAYPLLAFFKLYNDYMSQSQRFNNSILSGLLNNIKYGQANSTYWVAATGEIQPAGIYAMFNSLLLNYDNDYFTSAWQNPNCSLGGAETINSMKVPYTLPDSATTVGTFNYDNALTFNTGGSNVSLGQRALDFLQRFDDWVRRNNYSGSRTVQQIYSRFGIKTDDYKSHYAHVLATDTQPIQVGDIMQTSEVSATNPLGEYAGKGIMNGGKNVSVEVSDYGVILILGYFTVVPMNAYGFNRMVLRNNPLDYYTPEFDGVGADAIPVMEVFENPIGLTISDTVKSDAVFGFTERYNSYRFGRDNITGEFRKYRADDMNTWHTGRLLGEVRRSANLVAQSTAMNTLEQTDSQYNRIFSITDGCEDKFYLTCKFNVEAFRPMLSLNQVPRLGEGDTVVPRNGNVIS